MHQRYIRMHKAVLQYIVVEGGVGASLVCMHKRFTMISAVVVLLEAYSRGVTYLTKRIYKLFY